MGRVVGGNNPGRKPGSKNRLNTKISGMMTKQLKERCREHTEDCIGFLAQVVMDTGEMTKDRITAAKIILAYGWGNPQQALDVTSDGQAMPQITVAFAKPAPVPLDDSDGPMIDGEIV